MTETINPANNWALVEKRLGEESDPVLIVWRMSEDGSVLGEDSYTGKDGFAGIETRKLAPDAIATVKAG